MADVQSNTDATSTLPMGEESQQDAARRLTSSSDVLTADSLVHPPPGAPSTEALGYADIDTSSQELPRTQEGKFVNEATYEITSRIRVDLETGEHTSQLVNRTPVNLDYQSDVPPKNKQLLGRNIDILVDRSGTPTVRQIRERQLVSDAFGLSTKGGRYNENRRGRGQRGQRGR